MTTDGGDKRKERYRELRRLGFDSRTANRLKDQSGPNIERAIQARYRNLQNRENLSTQDAAYFERLERRQVEDVQHTIEITYSESDRQSQFEEWSQRDVGFPDEINQAIREINRQAGLPFNDGYGYRRFYYEFVKREPPNIASRLADRDDS